MQHQDQHRTEATELHRRRCVPRCLARRELLAPSFAFRRSYEDHWRLVDLSLRRKASTTSSTEMVLAHLPFEHDGRWISAKRSILHLTKGDSIVLSSELQEFVNRVARGRETTNIRNDAIDRRHTNLSSLECHWRGVCGEVGLYCMLGADLQSLCDVTTRSHAKGSDTFDLHEPLPVGKIDIKACVFRPHANRSLLPTSQPYLLVPDRKLHGKRVANTFVCVVVHGARVIFGGFASFKQVEASPRVSFGGGPLVHKIMWQDLHDRTR